MGQRAQNSFPGSLSSRAAAALPALIMSIILIFSLSAFAQDKNMVLEGSGIVYPAGFDLNTVGEIKGNAGTPSVPETGPVTFGLRAQKDFYTIIAAPGWFWKQSGFILDQGSAIVVKGSKSLGKDNNLYVIAQDITNETTGITLTLRGKDGKPVWSGKQHMPGPAKRSGTMQRQMQKGQGSGGQHRRGK